MKLSLTSKTGFKVSHCSDLLNTCPGENEGSGSQGNAFNVFVLLASKRPAILLSEIFLL